MDLKQIEKEALHPSEKDETFAKFPFSVIPAKTGIQVQLGSRLALVLESCPVYLTSGFPFARE